MKKTETQSWCEGVTGHRETGQPAWLRMAFVLALLTMLMVILWGAPASADAAPRAKNNSYTTKEDTTLRVRAPGVLKNDGPRGKVYAKYVRASRQGSSLLRPNGSLIYEPKTNFHGKDTIVYRACLKKKPRRCTRNHNINLRVTSVNDRPVARADSYSMTEDKVLKVSAGNGLFANDRDVDGDKLRKAENFVANAPGHGSISVDDDGSLEYTPDKNFSGTDSFVYRVTDGKLTSVAQVTIRVSGVNDRPVARNDYFLANKNKVRTITAPGVLRHDYDPDGDRIRVVNKGRMRHGTWTVRAPGKVVFRPSKNFTGRAIGRYTISDGRGGRDTARVTFQVR